VEVESNCIRLLNAAEQVLSYGFLSASGTGEHVCGVHGTSHEQITTLEGVKRIKYENFAQHVIEGMGVAHRGTQRLKHTCSFQDGRQSLLV
jgi:hypothetical protein